MTFPRPIYTDTAILQIAKKIQSRQDEIIQLIEQIRSSDHPHAKEIAQELENNLFGHAASAIHVVHSCFEHPELWEIDGSGIERKRRYR